MKGAINIDLTGIILKGRYCIVEQVGRGGEGSMYLARDLELGIFRAVKELPASSRREAGLLRLLEHPYLPKMIDKCSQRFLCTWKNNGSALWQKEIPVFFEMSCFGEIYFQMLPYRAGEALAGYRGGKK